MSTEHFQVSVGMDVLGADQERVGQVKEVRASDFLVERPLQRDVYVPFAAIREVTGNQVVLTVTSEHVDALKWPQEEGRDTSAAEDSDSSGPIEL
ncbi:MAG TPA: DUF2171 domain-containing protein [Chloroflexota bacterium]|jgi:hypothetical protein|nr:DUF2171 domain-containing protein [Chloroflexota bacterium]